MFLSIYLSLSFLSHLSCSCTSSFFFLSLSHLSHLFYLITLLLPPSSLACPLSSSLSLSYLSDWWSHISLSFSLSFSLSHLSDSLLPCPFLISLAHSLSLSLSLCFSLSLSLLLYDSISFATSVSLFVSLYVSISHTSLSFSLPLFPPFLSVYLSLPFLSRALSSPPPSLFLSLSPCLSLWLFLHSLSLPQASEPMSIGQFSVVTFERPLQGENLHEEANKGPKGSITSIMVAREI